MAVQALQCLSLIVILAAAVCSGISVFLSIHERVLNMTTIILMNTAGMYFVVMITDYVVLILDILHPVCLCEGFIRLVT